MDLDKIVKKIVSLYVSSAVLGAIVFILTLGEPFVMLGTIGMLGLITLLGDAVAEYGIEAVLNAFYAERSKKESVQSLLEEIEFLPITAELKFKVKNQLSSTECKSNQETLTEPPRAVEIEE
jgi:hypothetical protein